MSAPITELAAPCRAPVGSARETRAQLADQRGTPLLVSVQARMLGDAGILGPPVRRRLLRFVFHGVPAMVAAGAGALVAFGFHRSAPLAPQLAASAVLLSTTAAVTWRRFTTLRAGRRATWREELELGGLLVVLAATMAQASLGRHAAGDAPLQPLVYLAVAALVAILPRGAGLAVAGFSIALEGATWWVQGADAEKLSGPFARAGFTVLFALLYHGVLGARIAAGRRAEAAALERRKRELDDRARQLRLLAASYDAGEGDPGDRAERLAEAAVLETDAAARGLLEVAESALAANTAAVWLLTDDDRELRLWECRSPSDCVAERLPAGEGPPGVVVKRRAAVRLHGGVKSANHYQDATRPRAVLAVPLLARVGGHLRGVVLVDRMTAAPFTDGDERLLSTLAAELARSAEAERLIRDGRANRAEQERFYQAIERLNKTTTPREVFDAVIEVAAAMVRVDFGAVTLVEGSGSRVRHRVSRAVLSGITQEQRDGAQDAEGPYRTAAELEGREFPDNGGLVACAVRLSSSLPGKALDPKGAVVFDEATRMRGLASVKVLPLRAGESVLGTLVLGSKVAGAYGPDAVRQLEVVAMQAGDSILRARLFEATERLATTDGLTGLVNHRTFQARLDEHLASAQRYGKKVSLLLTDIDHFKGVNDTYGHPVGDIVLKQVAKILQKEARTTDVAARYGGEEFALVMPETDLAGAVKTAERIRLKVAQARFASDRGELKVTLSVGVATFPGDATSKAQLIERADGGLYHAKRHGRNQTVALAALRGSKRAG